MQVVLLHGLAARGQPSELLLFGGVRTDMRVAYSNMSKYAGEAINTSLLRSTPHDVGGGAHNTEANDIKAECGRHYAAIIMGKKF